MKRAKVNEEKEQYWKSHLEASKRSGKSAIQYCRDEGLSKSQYCYWKARLSLPLASKEISIVRSDVGFAKVMAEAAPVVASRAIKIRVTEFELSNMRDLHLFLSGKN